MRRGQDGQVSQVIYFLRRRHWFGAVAGAIAFGVNATASAVPLDQLANAARTATPGIFGFAEFTTPALQALPQWNRVQARMAADDGGLSKCVQDGTQCHTSVQRSWRQAIAAAAGLEKAQRPAFIKGNYIR